MAFVSSALGSPHRYRTWITDRVGFLVSAHAPGGGRIACCPTDSQTDDYVDVQHNRDQAAQVLVDYNAWDLQVSK